MNKRLNKSLAAAVAVSVFIGMASGVTSFAAKKEIKLATPVVMVAGGKAILSADKTPDKLYLNVTCDSNIKSVEIVDAKTYKTDTEKTVAKAEKVGNVDKKEVKKNTSAYLFDLSKESLNAGAYYIIVKAENGQESIKRFHING